MMTRKSRPAPITIASIGAGDLHRVATLHAVCFPVDGWDRGALAEILAMNGASGRMALVAGDAGRTPLGFLFDLAQGEEGEIITLGVAPAARRRGIGRALIADLFARARRRGINRLVLEVAEDNDGARRLYEEMGFQIAGRRPGYYRRPGGVTIDAWLLEKSLADGG